MPEIEEAQEILEAFGMPRAQHNTMSGIKTIYCKREAPFQSKWT